MTTNAVTGNGMTLSVGGDALAGSRSFTVSWSQATVDVTSRDDNFQGQYLAGRRDVTIDIDALYVYTDIAKKVIFDHIDHGTPATVAVVVTMPDAATFTGVGIVTAFSLVGPSEDALTYTASIQITEGLAVSAS